MQSVFFILVAAVNTVTIIIAAFVNEWSSQSVFWLMVMSTLVFLTFLLVYGRSDDE